MKLLWAFPYDKARWQIYELQFLKIFERVSLDHSEIVLYITVPVWKMEDLEWYFIHCYGGNLLGIFQLESKNIPYVTEILSPKRSFDKENWIDGVFQQIFLCWPVLLLCMVIPAIIIFVVFSLPSVGGFYK